MTGSISILVKLGTQTSTKPHRALADIAPFGWPSNHQEDEYNNVYRSSVVTHDSGSVDGDFHVKIECAKTLGTNSSILAWSMEERDTEDFLTMLVQESEVAELSECFKAGTVNSLTWNTLKTTLGQVPGGGQPSPNTQEAFTCRVWVKDALLALHDAGVIRLTTAIASIEEDFIAEAEAHRNGVEQGCSGARIWDGMRSAVTS